MTQRDATQAPEPRRKPGAPARAPGAPPRPKRPGPTRKRRFGRFVLVAAGLLTALVIVVAQSGLLRYLIVPRIEAMIGASIDAGRTTIERGGEIVIRSPSLRARIDGLPETAARFVTAEDLRVTPDWSALLAGRVELLKVELTRPVIRVSQDADLKLNIRGVIDELSKSGGGMTLSRLPEVRVLGATIEFGEHDAGPPATYREFTSLRVSGVVKPDPAAPGRYLVDFFEEKPGVRDGAPGQPADPLRAGKLPGLASSAASPKMRVDGTLSLNPASADLKLTNVDLAEVGRRQAPSWFEQVWGDLRLAGEIPTVRFAYSPDRGFSFSFEVVGVGMNIPVPTEPDLDAKGDPVPGAVGERRLMALKDVTGRVSMVSRGVEAELNATLEDFPLVIRLRTQGRDLNAALTCDLESRGFLISNRPKLLPFAPPFVRFLFQRLGGPTGEAEGLIKLSRGAPLPDGSAAAIKAAGTLRLRNGTMAHELFAYPVSQVSGVVNFDDQKVELLNIKGSNPSGARVLASGVISPPDETAAADINVTVVDIPIDAAFREALPEKRRVVYDALADERTYKAMLDEGLIQTAAQKTEREKRLSDLRTRLAVADRLGGGVNSVEQMERDAAELERLVAVPVFELGGLAQMEIHVTRELGAEAETKADVHLTADRIGLMLRAFPLPIIASRVDMLLGGSLTTMKPISVTTPRGGSGVVTGSVGYPDGGGIVPMVDIAARGVPLDDLFVRALPDPPTRKGKVSARSLVSGMNFAGVVDARAIVRADPKDPESASFRIDLGASGISANPGGAGPEITGIAGGVSVFDGAVEVPYLNGWVGGREVTLEGRAWYGDGPGVVSTGRIESGSLDLSVALDNLIRPATPVTADRLRALRERHLPEGCADVSLSVVDAPERSGVVAEIRSIAGGAFDAAGKRFAISDAAGRIGATERGIEFDGFTMSSPPAAAGSMTGMLALDDATATTLSLEARNAAFESPIVRALAEIARGDVGEFVRDADPSGLFSASVVHRRNQPVAGTVTNSGWIEPASLAFTRRGVRVNLPEISGRVSFDGESGRFESLVAKAPAWTVSADGGFAVGDRAGLDLTLSVSGDTIGPDFRAALPAQVAEALKNVEFGESGKFSMDGATLRLRPGSPALFKGDIHLDGVALKPVVAVTDAVATVKVQTSEEPNTAKPVALDVDARSFRLAGVRMEGGRAALVVDPETGAVRMERFEAACHGGRLSARASVGGRIAGDSSAGRPYEFAADLSSVGFAELLDDLMAGTPLSKAGEEGKGPVNRGRLDGSIGVAGVLEQPRSRRGRGLLRVQDGEVLNMPAVVPILRLSNLQPPVSERVGFGYADFYLTGDRLRFDEFTLQSESLAIDGRGSVTWPGLEVEMRFVTRSLNRIPMLTDLLEGVRDELVTTVVSGTLTDPDLKYEQLSATRQVLDQMFGKKRKDEPPEADAAQPQRTPEP